jgi:hypothetical protein
VFYWYHFGTSTRPIDKLSGNIGLTDLVDTGFDAKWIFSKISGLACDVHDVVIVIM